MSQKLYAMLSALGAVSALLETFSEADIRELAEELTDRRLQQSKGIERGDLAAYTLMEAILQPGALNLWFAIGRRNDDSKAAQHAMARIRSLASFLERNHSVLRKDMMDVMDTRADMLTKLLAVSRVANFIKTQPSEAEVDAQAKETLGNSHH